MVDISLEQPGDHLFIRAVDERGIQVQEAWYTGSLVVGWRDITPAWPPERIEDIDAAHLDPVLAMNPEVVLIGSGARQRFLAPELMMKFLGAGIGVEVMTTAAACRTFNVLAGDGRRVVAALISPQA